MGGYGPRKQARDRLEPFLGFGGYKLILRVIAEHGIDITLLGEFSQALNDVPPEYIKICPICDATFVAGRHDAGGCTPRCCSVQRVRRLRAA